MNKCVLYRIVKEKRNKMNKLCKLLMVGMIGVSLFGCASMDRFGTDVKSDLSS